MSVARAFLIASYATPGTRGTRVATGSLTRRSTATSNRFPVEPMRPSSCEQHEGARRIVRINLYDTYETLFTIWLSKPLR